MEERIVKMEDVREMRSNIAEGMLKHGFSFLNDNDTLDDEAIGTQGSVEVRIDVRLHGKGIERPQNGQEMLPLTFSIPIWQLLDRQRVMQMEGVCIYLLERRITVDGKDVWFTPKEFDLLVYLMENANRVIGRQKLLEELWDDTYSGDERTVDTHIKCLRAKLGEYGKHIITARKVGYKLSM